MPVTKELTLTPLPPKEAIAFFGAKVDIPAAEFYSMVEEIRSLAFTVSRVANMDILADIHDAVQAAIDDGETLSDFMGRLNDVMELKGWTGLSPWHAENVFRTNIAQAYSVGHENEYKKYQDDFPAAEYNNPVDDRSRSSHAQWDGMVFAVNDPFWDVWTPSSGFNCRCDKRFLHKYEIEDKGIKFDSYDPKVGDRPGEGFDYNPAKHQWRPKAKDYPRPLWSQYQAEKSKLS